MWVPKGIGFQVEVTASMKVQSSRLVNLKNGEGAGAVEAEQGRDREIREVVGTSTPF